MWMTVTTPLMIIRDHSHRFVKHCSGCVNWFGMSRVHHAYYSLNYVGGLMEFSALEISRQREIIQKLCYTN